MSAQRLDRVAIARSLRDLASLLDGQCGTQEVVDPARLQRIARREVQRGRVRLDRLG